MDQTTSDQNEENFPIYEIPDENWKPASGWKKQIQSPYGSVPLSIFARARSA